MERVVAIVLAAIVSAAVISSIAVFPLILSHSTDAPGTLSVTASGAPAVNITVSANWTKVAFQNTVNSGHYYVLDVYVTVVNNKTAAIPSLFSLYSNFRVLPVTGIQATLWTYSETAMGNNGTYSVLSPGQKSQDMFQIVVFPSGDIPATLPHSFLQGSHSYLNRSIQNYAAITVDSYAIVPVPGATLSFWMVNGSGMKAPVDMYGTCYNITDNIGPVS